MGGGEGFLRLPRRGALVVLACHGVYDLAKDCFHGDHPEDRPVYDAQLAYAFRHIAWQASLDPLLVISGGTTKAALDLSESRSYLERARHIGLSVPQALALEEQALTTPENIFFSIYAYARERGCFPAIVDAISWEFKRSRTERTLEAINSWGALGDPWPPLRFFPVGDLHGSARAHASAAEREDMNALDGGLAGYYRSSRVRALIAARDPFGRRGRLDQAYPGFPKPF